MMLLLLVMSVALLGLAAALVVRALGVNRARTAGALANIEAYGYGRNDDAEPVVATWALRDLVEGFAELLGPLVPAAVRGDEDVIRRDLVAAGIYAVRPVTFGGYRLLAMLAGLGVWTLLGVTVGLSSFLLVFGACFAAAVGWILPLRIVKSRARKRFKAIDKELPEMIDLLVVTVEAGIAFTGSLRMAAERLRGALGDELRLVLQEQSMGLAMDEALRNLLDRCNTPSMRTFVRAVLQGESLGVSIGQIMRNLALEFRKRRKAAAEERAQKAPVKILFPLIFLIFPAMWVVILGPAFFHLKEVFG
jgi:tight adherence protein C